MDIKIYRDHQKIVIEKFNIFMKRFQFWLGMSANTELRLKVEEYFAKLHSTINTIDDYNGVVEAEDYIFKNDAFYKVVSFCGFNIEYRILSIPNFEIYNDTEVDVDEMKSYYKNKDAKYHGSFTLKLLPNEKLSVFTYMKDELYLNVDSMCHTKAMGNWWNPLETNIIIIKKFESEKGFDLSKADHQTIQSHMAMIIDRIGIQMVMVDNTF